jgi:hypothetical protein
MKKNIFIFGEPRSGTTWLAKIFDSHPATLLRHEPDTVNPTVDFPFVMRSIQIDQYMDHARAYLHERTHDRQLRCVSSTPYFPKHYRSPLADQARKALILFSRGVDLLSGGKLDRRLKVPDMISNSRVPVNVVKSVDSTGRLPLFAKACPEDKFIFILRHPCGVVASKFRGRDLGKMDPAVTFRKILDLDSARDFGLTENQLDNWSTLEADAWEWMLTHDFIMKMASDLPNIHIVTYDVICESPVAQIQAIFDWAGLDWSAQTEEYINKCISVDPNARTGFYSTLQNPRHAANKWKTQLSNEQAREIMAICQKSDAGKLFSDHR